MLGFEMWVKSMLGVALQLLNVCAQERMLLTFMLASFVGGSTCATIHLNNLIKRIVVVLTTTFLYVNSKLGPQATLYNTSLISSGLPCTLGVRQEGRERRGLREGREEGSEGSFYWVLLDLN